jgi:hypothetical protein
MFARLVFQALPISGAVLLARGRLRLVTDRRSITLLALAALCLAASRFAARVAPALVVAAFAIGAIGLVRVFAATSRSRLLAGVAGVGCLANIVPIVAFGAMPVSVAARRTMSSRPAAEPAVFAAKHVETVTNSQIARLGDVIAVPMLRAVVSVGDVVVLVAFLCLGVLHAQRLRQDRSRPAS